MEQTPLGVKVQDMLYTLSPDILYTLGFASQDSTTIDLCLSVFPWARFHKHKGAVKMHTLLDLHGNIPTFTRITNGKVHEVNILDQLLLEAGAFYGMDRGYVALNACMLSRSRRHSAWCAPKETCCFSAATRIQSIKAPPCARIRQ